MDFNCANTKLSEIKRPEVAFRLFMRFAVAKGVVTYGMDIMVGIFDISQGATSSIVGGLASPVQNKDDVFSGTLQTINMATRKKRDIVIIEP